VDAGGKVVRTLTGKEAEKDVDEDHPDAPSTKFERTVLPKKAGLHRVVWDLRHEGARVIKGGKLDWSEPRSGPLALPGTYTIRLKAGDHKAEANLEVRQDPRSKVPMTELKEQLAFALQLREDIDRLVGVVEALRSLRRQLAARNELLEDDSKAAALVKRSKALMARLDALEAELHNPKAEVSYQIMAQKGGARLYSQLGPLFSLVKDAEGAPTQGMREVRAELSRRLDTLVQDWEALLRTELPPLNEQARSLGVPTVFVPQAKAGR
jgi:hypothetical protein